MTIAWHILIILFLLPAKGYAENGEGEDKKPPQNQNAEQDSEESDDDDKKTIKKTATKSLKNGKSTTAEKYPNVDLKNLTPEELISHVYTELKSLTMKVNGFSQIFQRQGLGSQTIMAKRALDQAKSDFEQSEFRSTVRNLNFYLNQTQVPKIRDYLDSQFMLGKAYDKLGEHDKATRAFSRYLSTLTTNPEYLKHEAIDVIADLLRLVEKNRSAHRIELGQLMAALTSLNIVQPQKAWIYFYAGKSARIVGNHKVAIYWLDSAIKLTKSSRLKARSRYNRSLVYIQLRQYKKAIEDLEYALKESSENASDYREWAKLSLGRVYVHLKKPKTALKYYDDILGESLAYEDGLFEKIYIYLILKNSEEAIIASEEFLLRFSKRPQAQKIRTIKAYLELSANKLNKAQKNIHLSNERLGAISQWLKENYQGRDTLTLRDIAGIMKVTGPEVEGPPLIRYGRKLFQRLNKLSQRSQNLRNDIRHTIFTLGRIKTSQMKPSWQHRMDQLRVLLKSNLSLGDSLSQAETAIYKNRLTDRDSYVLKSAHFRRQRATSELAKFARSKGPWQEWAALGGFNQRAARRFRQIKTMQAKLANLKLLTNTVKVRRKQARLSEIIELTHQTNVMESELLRALEISRSRQAMTSLAMSDLIPIKRLLKTQAETLFAENALLTEYRNIYSTPQQEHLQADLRRTWDLWEHTTEILYKEIIRLESSMRKSMTKRLSDFDHLIATHNKILRFIEDENKNLSRSLGKNISLILNHYQSRIKTRISKHQKWLADIKWLTFEKTTTEKSKAMEKYSLEQQILKENLKDLEQGVLWQWP